MSTVLEHTDAYTDVLERASHLSHQQKADLLVELATQMRDGEFVGKPHSILELRGAGKGVWEGIDAQEFVNQERNSWDG